MPSEFVKNKKEFIGKYGEIQLLTELNRQWHRVKEQQSCIEEKEEEELTQYFKGNFRTTGYHRTDEDPENIEDWEELDKVLILSSKCMEILSDYYEKTKIKSEFYPFVCPKKTAPGFWVTTFQERTGLNIPYSLYDLLGGFIRRKPKKGENIFTGDTKYLFKKSRSKPGLPSEKNGLQQVHLLMENTLSNNQVLFLPQEYSIYPVIRIGVSKKGYLAGFWTLRKTL